MFTGKEVHQKGQKLLQSLKHSIHTGKENKNIQSRNGGGGAQAKKSLKGPSVSMKNIYQGISRRRTVHRQKERNKTYQHI